MNGFCYITNISTAIQKLVLEVQNINFYKEQKYTIISAKINDN